MAKQFLRQFDKNIFTAFETDEETIYELQKHAEKASQNNEVYKLFFHEIGETTYAGANVWFSSIPNQEILGYHCHDYYEISIVTQGKCIEVINGAVKTLTAGDMLILPPDTAYHTFYQYKNAKSYDILIKSEFIAKLYSEFRNIKNNCFENIFENRVFSVFHCLDSSKTIDIISLLKKLFLNENQSFPKGDALSACAVMLSEKLAHALFFAIQNDIESGIISAEHEKNVSKVFSPDDIIYYIKDNFATVTEKELSKKFGYSERHIHRIIKNSTGNNFRILIMLERINHAKILLKNTSLSLEEISSILGLKSKEYLCNMFKSQTGISPMKYRAGIQSKK